METKVRALSPSAVSQVAQPSAPRLPRLLMTAIDRPQRLTPHPVFSKVLKNLCDTNSPLTLSLRFQKRLGLVNIKMVVVGDVLHR